MVRWWPVSDSANTSDSRLRRDQVPLGSSPTKSQKKKKKKNYHCQASVFIPGVRQNVCQHRIDGLSRGHSIDLLEDNIAEAKLHAYRYFLVRCWQTFCQTPRTKTEAGQQRFNPVPSASWRVLKLMFIQDALSYVAQSI